MHEKIIKKPLRQTLKNLARLDFRYCLVKKLSLSKILLKSNMRTSSFRTLYVGMCKGNMAGWIFDLKIWLIVELYSHVYYMKLITFRRTNQMHYTVLAIYTIIYVFSPKFVFEGILGFRAELLRYAESDENMLMWWQITYRYTHNECEFLIINMNYCCTDYKNCIQYFVFCT